MGWLSGYTYRMAVPVANTSTVETKRLTFDFPAWYLRVHPDGAKVAKSDFSDVHVTTSDGTTELPCELNAAKTQVTCQYTSMPLGKTTLYVYYGNSGASAPTAPPSSPIDNGFESGSDGASLDASATWVKVGTPGVEEYDNLRAASGTFSGHIQANENAYEGVKETTTSGMSGTSTELRFWVYCDTTNEYRLIRDTDVQADTTWNIRFNNTGGVDWLDPTPTASWVSLGATYSTGWMQYRVVANYTAKTWSVYRRASSSAEWTTLGTNLEFFNNTKTQSAGTCFLTYGSGSDLWFDHVESSSTGSFVATAGVEIMRADYEVTSEGDTSPLCYLWGSDYIDATYLNSGSASTYYGGSATTAHLAGITSAGTQYHYLLKPFIGALPLGTVSSAKLRLYCTNTNIAASTQLDCHRFKDYGNAESANFDSVVKTGWSCNDSRNYPTWTNRSYSETAAAAVPWAAAGATNSTEIDTLDKVSVTIAPGTSAGYQTFNLTTSWLSDWLGDDYAQGVLIKDSTDSAGGSNRYTSIDSQYQTNGPVLEVQYSSLSTDQLLKRKMTSDTYAYATFPTQDRYVVMEDTNGFAVMCWVNGESRVDVAYISSEGRISLQSRNNAPSGSRMSQTTPCYGIFYDPDEKRYWIGGSHGASQTLCVAYSQQYTPTNWTWSASSINAVYKSVISPKNGVGHCILYTTGTTNQVQYCTFTRSTGTWSSTTPLAAKTVGGTQATLGTQILSGTAMTGAGTISLTGSTADYPPYGAVKIDSEYFWYTGKTENTLTGVTRSCFGSTATLHTVGVTVSIDRGDLTYSCISHDYANGCMHISYTVNSTSGNFGYLYPVYMRHYYADPVGTWKKSDGTTISLPADNRTEQQVGDSTQPSYSAGSLVTDQGYYLISVLGLPDKTKWRAPNYTDSKVNRLSGTDFSLIDLQPSIREMSMLDMGSGDIVLTGVGGTDLSSVYMVRSEDGGATWDTNASTVATHTFADNLFVTGNGGVGDEGLWECGCATTANLDGYGLAYAEHLGYYGDVFLYSFDPVAEPLVGGFTTTREVSESLSGSFSTSRTVSESLTGSFSTSRTVTITPGEGFGTHSDYAYRMSVPVANPSVVGNRALDAVPFPAWFLKSQGKIFGSNYEDIRVTDVDDNELPFTLNSARNALYIDYASMPLGRTELYVYYGKSGATAPTACSYQTAARISSGIVTGTMATFDNGFEGRSDGTPLDSTIWDTIGSPQNVEYDTSQAKVGTVSAYVRGPAAAAYGGPRNKLTSSLGLSVDGQELSFWLYLDTANQFRSIDIYDNTAQQVAYLWWSSDGSLNVRTDKAGNPNGYTTGATVQVGTYSTGWMQYRLVFDWTGQRYTLSRRASTGDSWTVLKRTGATDDYIPMRANATLVGCTRFLPRAYQNTNLWFDNLQYNSPFESTTVQCLDANAEVISVNDGSPVYYVWGQDVDATYMDSSQPDTCFNTAATHTAGNNQTGDAFNYLAKFFEGALPKGTISDAKLYIYGTPAVAAGTATLRAYTLKNYGDGTAAGWSGVRTGWSVQSNVAPTWNTRMRDWQTGEVGGTARAWLGAGCTDANEVDTSTYSTVSITPSSPTGYYSFAIDATAATDWVGDRYSQGVIIRQEGAISGQLYNIQKPSSANSPVFVFTYASLSSNQLTGRKLSTDTYNNYAVFPIQGRCSSSDLEHGFMAINWTNQDMNVSTALVSPDGRIRRAVQNTSPSAGYLHYNIMQGLYYDTTSHRFWFASVEGGTSKLVLAYSDEYSPINWRWVVHPTIVTAKSSMVALGGVVHLFVLDTADSDKLKYLTYTLSSNTWSSATDVVTKDVAVKRNLVSSIAIDTVMEGSATIEVDGTISDYPEWGNLLIDSEHFWYTGKSGNTFTGVTRATHGTTAEAHSAATLVDTSVGIPTYTSIAYDPVRACFHVTWSHNRVRGASSTYEYQAVGYLRHYFADAATVWKDYADNTITLPVTPGKIKFVSEPDMLAYPLSMVCTDEGDIVIPNQKMALRGGLRVSEDIAWQHYGQTAISHTDASMMYASMVDLGGNRVAAVHQTSTIQRVSYSEDAGETFGSAQVLSTHTYPARSLSNNGVSSNARVLDTGLAYVQHSTAHGALVLNAVDFPVMPPSNVVVTSTSVTWSDNSSSELGFNVQLSEDGGDFSTVSGSPTAADATSLSVTLIPGHTYTARVQSYDAQGTSEWVQSEPFTYAETLDGSFATSRSVTEVLAGVFASTRSVSEAVAGVFSVSRTVAETLGGAFLSSRAVGEALSGAFITTRTVSEVLGGTFLLARTVSENLAGTFATSRTITASAELLDGSFGTSRTVLERMTGVFASTRSVCERISATFVTSRTVTTNPNPVPDEVMDLEGKTTSKNRFGGRTRRL